MLLVPLMGCLDEPRDDEKEPNGPPYTGEHPGYEVITTDTEWRDLEGLTPGPVWVANGSKLRIEGCDLKIPIEDMAYFFRPWFVVEEGSFLEFEDSKVEITMDPRLKGALRMPYSVNLTSTFPPPPVTGQAPLLFRTLNLVDTTAPVLTVDVRPLGEVTFVVGIQEAPGEELEVLGQYHLSADERGDWDRIEVPLEDYSGGTPRAVFFLKDDIVPHAIMTVPTVTDGGRSPPHDDFSFEFDGGWATVNLDDVDDMVYSWFDESWFIECRGEVRVWSSTMSCAPEAPRTKYEWSEDDLLRVDEPRSRPRNLDVLGEGWHVDVDGGSLEIVGSDFSHLPIHLNSSSVHILDSTLVGNNLLNLASSNGSVEDTDFIHETVRTWEYDRWRDLTFEWAVSACNVSEYIDFTLTGCSFDGFPEAIDLNDADVDITGCEFWRNQNVAVWDHREGLEDGWTELSVDNLFQDCEGILYLRTHTAVIDFNGPVPLSRYNFYGFTDHEELDIGPDASLPEVKLLIMHENLSVISLPTFIAYADGGTRPVDSLRTELYTNWGGWAIADLDTSMAHFDDVYNWYDEWYFTASHWGFFNNDPYTVPPVEKGWLIRVGVDFRFRKNPGDVSVLIDLDGRRIENDTIYEFDWNNQGKAYIQPYVDVPPGRHKLEITLTDAKPWFDIEPTFTKSVEIDLIRVTEHSEPDILSKGPLHAGTVILVDQNVTFRSEGPIEFVHVNTPTKVSFNISNNSTLVLSSIGRNDRKDIDFDVRGGGRLELGNGTVGFADIDLEGGSLRLVDVKMFYLDLSGSGCNVSVEECEVLISHDLYLRDGSAMTFRSSEICATLGPSRGRLRDSGLMYTDCLISSKYSFAIEFKMEANSSIEVKGCDVTNVFLEVLHATGDWEGHITDCTFSGEYAGILVDLHEDSVDGETMPLPRGLVEGNTFEGPDCGIVMNSCILGEYLGENLLKRGARMLAKYHWRFNASGPGGDDTEGLFFVEGKGAAPYYDDWPFDDFQGREHGVLFLDVTSDRSIVLAPPEATGIIRSSGTNYRGDLYFSQFITIDITDPVNELVILDWDSMLEIVEQWKANN